MKQLADLKKKIWFKRKLTLSNMYFRLPNSEAELIFTQLFHHQGAYQKRMPFMLQNRYLYEDLNNICSHTERDWYATLSRKIAPQVPLNELDMEGLAGTCVQ